MNHMELWYLLRACGTSPPRVTRVERVSGELHVHCTSELKEIRKKIRVSMREAALA